MAEASRSHFTSYINNLKNICSSSQAKEAFIKAARSTPSAVCTGQDNRSYVRGHVDAGLRDPIRYRDDVTTSG
jgi:hypothetical protein